MNDQYIPRALFLYKIYNYFIYYKLPGAYIPETWLNKLKEASDKSPEEEKKIAEELSINLFNDMIKIHKKMHIMSMNNYDFVVNLLKNIN